MVDDYDRLNPKYKMGVSHQFDLTLYETWHLISCTYMSSSVQIYSIYRIWYSVHTQNSDKFWSRCNSHKKK